MAQQSALGEREAETQDIRWRGALPGLDQAILDRLLNEPIVFHKRSYALWLDEEVQRHSLLRGLEAGYGA